MTPHGLASERLPETAATPEPEAGHAVIEFSPRAALAILTLLIAAAYLASVLVQLALFAGGYQVPPNIVRLLDLDEENNPATWLSSTMLLTGSVLAAFIASAKRTRRDAYTPHWFGLCLIFLYLSLDETASIHEIPSNRVKSLVGASGAFYAAWVIPAMVVVGIFALVYLRFLFSLPRRIQALIVAAGGLYVLGAAGFEMLGWHHRAPMFDPDNHLESRDLAYMMINHLEELLEMLGAAVFIYALLSYMAHERISVSTTASRV